MKCEARGGVVVQRTLVETIARIQRGKWVDPGELICNGSGMEAGEVRPVKADGLADGGDQAMRRVKTGSVVL